MTLISKLFAPGSRPRPARKPALGLYSAIAEAAGTLQHYQDVPVRFQKQWIASFLTVTVVVGLVAGLYLNVTASAAITGREIQNLELAIASNERVNADLQTDIATLLSNTVLQERAVAAGFVPVARADLEYLVVPGYTAQPGLKLVMVESPQDFLSTSPEYSESLLDWLARQVETASVPLAQVP